MISEPRADAVLGRTGPARVVERRRNAGMCGCSRGPGLAGPVGGGDRRRASAGSMFDRRAGTALETPDRPAAVAIPEGGPA